MYCLISLFCKWCMQCCLRNRLKDDVLSVIKFPLCPEHAYSALKCCPSRQLTRFWNRTIIFSVFPWQSRYPGVCCFILPEQKSKTEKEGEEKLKKPRFPIRVPPRWPSRIDSLPCKSSENFYNPQQFKTLFFSFLRLWTFLSIY